MNKSDRVEAQNVSMYPRHWEIVDRVASEIAAMLGSNPERSRALRVIIEQYEKTKRLPQEAR